MLLPLSLPSRIVVWWVRGPFPNYTEEMMIDQYTVVVMIFAVIFVVTDETAAAAAAAAVFLIEIEIDREQ